MKKLLYLVLLLTLLIISPACALTSDQPNDQENTGDEGNQGNENEVNENEGNEDSENILVSIRIRKRG